MGRPRTTNSHLPKYVTVRGPSYWYGPTGQKPVRICAVGDFQNLYKFLADKMEPSREARTIGDLFDRYIREELPKLAEQTQHGYLDHLTKLRAWCGHMHPDELTSRDVGRYLRPEGVSTGLITRNRQIAVLSAVYGYAVGMWYTAERNPCLQVKRNKREKRTRYITDDEFNAMRSAVPAAMRIAMDLALLTGQRQGDLLSLKWDQVSADGIYFKQGKTVIASRAGRRFEVGPAIAARLRDSSTARAARQRRAVASPAIQRIRLPRNMAAEDAPSGQGWRAQDELYVPRHPRQERVGCGVSTGCV